MSKEITYEFALEIKEAGFSQKLGDGAWFYNLQSTPEKVDKETIKLKRSVRGIEFLQNENQINEWDLLVKIPTLDEAIEACREEVKDHVISIMIYPDHVSVGVAGLEKPIVGKTPKEAVLRLWLELKKRGII